MTGVRLSTRTELKRNISEIYNCINVNKPLLAMNLLDRAEMNVIMYYNTRGIECERFLPIFSDIRNCLRKFSRKQLYKTQLYNYLLKLNKEMRASTFIERESGNNLQDPILILKHLSEDLIDDYSAFNLGGGQDIVERNCEILDLIRNDLLEMRELEPFFKDKSDADAESFNSLLKHINQALTILPQVKDISVSTANAKLFRQFFEALLHQISDMCIPVKKKEIVEAELVKDAKIEPEILPEASVEDKSLKKLAKEQGMDLDEMERRAKESFFDGSEGKS